MRDVTKLNEICEHVGKCDMCHIHENGKAMPTWGLTPQYCIIAEAPGEKEVTAGTPLVGPAGKILFEILEEFDLYRSDFGLINTIQCRPMEGNRNGKPTIDQIKSCKPFVEKFLGMLMPWKILIMGNYARYYFDNRMVGVTADNGKRGTVVFKRGHEVVYIPATLSVHPAVAIYEGEKGKDKLRYAISKFIGRDSERRKSK